MSTETSPAYSPGLAGVIAGESAISCVDADAGLLYRGYDIHELASRASFEELVFLLLKPLRWRQAGRSRFASAACGVAGA